ncbi:mannose-6-phosphate isomerase, class I [Microlunatus panaciterrae]
MQRLVGKVQPYAWGSTTAIPELLGVDPTGEPQAELWLGAHPSAPSRWGDQSLQDAVAADPEAVVGAASVQEFGPRLPYLLKVLAAAQPLSLQAHPSRAEAEAGFAREQQAGIALDAPERTYRDDWPKPEALCALGEMEALCGFREPAETYALLARLGVAELLDLVAPLERGGSEALAEVFGRLLRLPADQREVVGSVAEAAHGHIDDPGPFGDLCRTAEELATFYPGDPGVLAALLMSRVRFGKHQALFLPAGNLHAYLHGTGVEIMANSDNVLRGGLTPKHVDVDELLRLLDFTPGFPGLVDAVEEQPGVWAYQTPAPEFALWRLDLTSTGLALPGEGSGRVVLVTDGQATLVTKGCELVLDRGGSAFVAAADREVRVAGTGTVFVGGPGVR